MAEKMETCLNSLKRNIPEGHAGVLEPISAVMGWEHGDIFDRISLDYRAL